MKSFILSSSGINNILQEEKEFTFVFGKYEIRMNNINSEFISPIVSFLHQNQDPTINKYYFVPTEKHTVLQEKDIFSEDVITLFQDISKGKTINIKDEQINKLIIISILIGNEELFNALLKNETKEILDIDEIIKIIEITEFLPFKTFLKIDELFEIISSNFYKLDKTKLKTFPKRILYEIISNDHLKLENEDSLFEFIEEIFEILTNESGGNVQDKGTISVTASSENNSGRLAKFAVDLIEIQTRFLSNDVENSWLKYDFKEKKIHPTGYSIRSKPYGKGEFHPLNWVIEASNTDREDDWKILDEKSNYTELNDRSVTRTFKIEEKLKSNEFFRFIRIRQTGKNANGSNYLVLSALEYFGYLI